jgi:hypothetical protein
MKRATPPVKILPAAAKRILSKGTWEKDSAGIVGTFSSEKEAGAAIEILENQGLAVTTNFPNRYSSAPHSVIEVYCSPAWQLEKVLTTHDIKPVDDPYRSR